MSIFIFFLLVLSTSLVVYGQQPTAYDILQNYNLPRGILPLGVRDYDLNQQTGAFKVHFDATCQFTIETYKIEYKSTFTGVLTKGRISSLTGVSVKMLFFWLDISDVSLDGDDLNFSVGMVSEDFSANYFTNSPQCGCGFRCNGFDIRS